MDVLDTSTPSTQNQIYFKVKGTLIGLIDIDPEYGALISTVTSVMSFRKSTKNLI